MPRTDRQETAERDKLRRRAEAMPVQPEVLRMAIKRQIWIEEMTVVEFAPTIRMNPCWFRRRLMDGKHIHPALLNKIIAGLEVSPREARRWHRMAAREAGWQV